MATLHTWLISGLWLAWLAYWVVAALGAKAARRREPPASRAFDFTLLGLGLALLVPDSHRFGGWLSERVLPRTEAAFWIGAALVALGLAVAVWARVHLGNYWSGTVALKQDHALIRSGPYGWVRNPIYSGLLLVLLGSATALGEWRGFLALGLFAAAFLRRIAIEERWLADAFPDQYPRYRTEVARLIPLLY